MRSASGGLPTGMVENPSASAERLVEELSTALPGDVDAHASALGKRFGDATDVVQGALSRLNAAAPQPDSAGDIARLVRAAIHTPNPVAALDGITALLDVANATWPPGDTQAQALACLLSGSSFLTSHLLTHPDALGWLLNAIEAPVGRDELSRDFALAVDSAPTIDEIGVLREWHMRHLARIACADLADMLDIADVAAQLSMLADVALDEVCRFHARSMDERFGRPLQDDGTPAGMCVIGLGKLGGEELNFRSDIDLMFVYSDEGHSEGATSDGLTLHEWYSRLASRIMATLSEVSADGMLYRVDARLRPDGRSGALARSLASYILYYETRGEVWERQMLVKARPVAGDLSVGSALLESLKPFVYPRTHNLSPRDEIHRVKSRILAHLAARDTQGNATEIEWNLKLRRGGLRDIEFIVQCLQLVVGGAAASIRQRNSLDAIDRMAEQGVLSDDEAASLVRAYRLYRKVEHRLQMVAGQQTFTLPVDAEARTVLALQLGYANAQVFLADLESVRSDVARIYDDVLGAAGGPDKLEVLLELPRDSDQVEHLLAPYGFRDPAAAHRNLHHLAHGHGETFVPSGPRPAVVRLVPGLLEQLSESPDADRGLTNFERALTALGAVESFCDLLASHPRLLELLTKLFSGSQSLTDTALRDTALIDWMLYSGVLTAERRTNEIGLVLRAAVAGLGDDGEILRAIHTFRKQEVLRVGVGHLLDLADDAKTGAELSAIADATVCGIHAVKRTEIYGRRGQPLDQKGDPAEMAVLAMGKLGSHEMNFGSDLDLIFVHQAEGTTTQGKANVQVFIALAQGVVRSLSEATEYGTLYEVDTRLRPEGRAAPLTIAFEGFKNYLANRALTWERQALTRARTVIGQGSFGNMLMDVIHDFVYAPYDDALISEVASMRVRMERESARKYPGRINIKTGPGGLVDAEFVAQLGQILYGKDDTAFRGIGTIAALERMKDAGRLPEGIASDLIRGRRWMHALQTALRIDDEHARNVLPTDEPEATTLARKMGQRSASDLHDATEQTMEETRRAYLSAIDVLGKSA